MEFRNYFVRLLVACTKACLTTQYIRKTISSLSTASTKPKLFFLLPDINELTGDLFPNSPKQFYEDEITHSSKVEDQRRDNGQNDEKISTHVTDTEKTTNNRVTPDIGSFDDRTVEKLKISLPATSPIWSSCYSSSSESSSSSRANKVRKRFCVACNQRFRKTSELHKHLLTHVTQPSVELERLSPSNKYYQDFLKRQSSEAGVEEITGFKIKLKVLSGAQNFEVIPNALDEENRGKGIRILTAKEIKLSPNRSASSSTNASPLDAMVALSEMTFSDNSNTNTNYMSEQDKLHFECPTLDGLDQFNEEVNKEAAAQLLKQLLETPQMPQENEWTPTTNEYISIDRLAHMCPVCHSNFPDAVMLYEHKRITGHDFQNLFQQQSSMPNGAPRPFLRPRAQTQMAVYGQPQLHQPNQPNQNHFPHHQQPQQGAHMQQQQDPAARYGVRFPMRPMIPPQRRTPPPLYRPNGQPMPQNQPLNMAPFMSMSPEMYNPMPGANGMNNSTIMNSNSFAQNSRISPLQRSSPQQRVSPLQRVSPHLMPQQQQQQQIGGHPQQQFNSQHSQGMMRPPINMNMMRQMRPVPGQPPHQLNQLAARQPLYTMRRAPNGMMIRTPITQTQLASHLRPRLMGPPAKRIKVEDGDDCEVISMQPRSEGLPVIHSVQGGANAPESTQANTNSTEKPNEPYQLSEITLSVKGKEQPNKNPKEVATILAHRGITVTSSKPVDQREKSPSEVGSSTTANVTADEAVQKIQLNSSVSIIQKKKPTTTIDLSNDDDVEPVATAARAITCTMKDCNEVFASQDSLNRHLQRGHKMPPSTNQQLRVNRCRLCPAKFSSAEGLILHQKKVHRVFKTTASELGLPVVDLSNEETRSKLAALGICNYIPLSHLNRSNDNVFGLPIVSVQGAANQAVCNLAALGADSLLSIGQVKAIPKNPTLTTKPTES